jgi:uncharacterized protein YecE (DUF72 family)
MEYLVGTGGWSYFEVNNKVSLRLYSKVFNFVEVNYTFYQYPSNRTVELWRRNVPSNFTFSIRCHQDLTHKIGLKPETKAYEIFDQMKTYCNILQTPYLVFETPAKYVINQQNIKETRDFFATINYRGLTLIWEYRAPTTPTITNLMQDYVIVPVIDLSRQKPREKSDIIYSRIFGKGQHNLYQFTDEELIEIDQNAQASGSKTVIMAYHGARMHSDAARFSKYKATGKFIPTTDFTGAESAKAVLSEDTKFPAAKAELEAKQGWKVFDLTKDKRVHLSEELKKIPDKTYSDLDHLMKELEGVL